MRFLGLSLSLSLLFAGFSLCALAQVQNLTDAQRVDLAGPVKSVSVETTTATGVVWSPPGGPTLVLPIWCHECEFDPNGNGTKFGQIIDGRFQGETVHLFFDGQGNVTERVAADAETGETVRHETAGPFGNTEETSYRGGALAFFSLTTSLGTELIGAATMKSFDASSYIPVHSDNLM